MLKSDLRDKYSKNREQLFSSDITDKSIAIGNAALSIPIWNFTNYHIFLPIEHKKEVDTEAIIAIILGKDKNVIVPKMIGESQLEHYLLTDNTTFTINPWGVPEPVDGITVAPNKIDVVFIPLLAFDESGNRIGYGKGYYDRFLQQCKKETIKIGLSFFEAEKHIADISDYDIPLDFCITPTKTYSFTSS